MERGGDRHPTGRQAWPAVRVEGTPRKGDARVSSRGPRVTTPRKFLGHRQRRLEFLLGLVVVEAPVVQPPRVDERAAELEYLAERDALPQPLAERPGDVVALHRLQKPDAVRLAHLEQGRQVEGGLGVEGERAVDGRLVLGDDFEPPRLGREPGVDEGVALQGVRDRAAPAHVLEVLGGGEERPGRQVGGGFRGVVGGRVLGECGDGDAHDAPAERVPAGERIGHRWCLHEMRQAHPSQRVGFLFPHPEARQRHPGRADVAGHVDRPPERVGS